MSSGTSKINWNCNNTWKKSAKNTTWCLLGCSIGDFGTIFFFQVSEITFPVLGIMFLAVINGLITSITLETIILVRQNFNLKNAIKTAFGMSFISMIGMEIAMNLTDFVFTGGAILNWYILPLMLFAGFITPLPYNYYKLKKYNISCH